jgi:CDP-glycerol glycerophosphotransferase (TagB/SpsB family)
MATDVLVTDYSSSIFEWALLQRPLVLLVPDLAAYERDPGLYLDYRTEMIGAQVVDTAGVAAAILAAKVDPLVWDAFLERHLGPGIGHASERFVERFVTPRSIS